MGETDNFIDLAGHRVGFIPPTQGQIEAMIRISRSVQRGGEDEDRQFWIKQIGRIGDLLDKMIVEADHELVEELYICGQIDHSALLTAILAKVNDNAEKSEDQAIAKAKKVSGARVQRK